MKYFALRFDVDTPKCLTEGIPNLLVLAEKEKVKFTFFVHFGRSLNRKKFIASKFKKNKKNEKITQLSALDKLGYVSYAKLALLNPEMGKVGRNIIKRIYAEGHEIGLHGGKNHEDWNLDAKSWSLQKIDSEIFWGEKEFEKIVPNAKLKSFAAPHWKYNKKIYKVLKKRGYEYVSDIHTNIVNQKITKSFGLLANIPVNIAGEPGGVGYLEWCRARGMNDRNLLLDFENKLSKRGKFATVYDHPYYSGVQEIKVLRKMIHMAKNMNFKVVTFANVVNKL